MTSVAIAYTAPTIGGLTRKPLVGWTGRSTKPKPKGSLHGRIATLRQAGAFKKGR